MSILVIEDDNDLRPEIVEYLERRGHRLASCASLAEGREALERAIHAAQSPQAIICDRGLPDGDGLDLYLAFAPRLPFCQWILMSGGRDDDLERRVAAAGLHQPTVVEKPIPMRALRALIDDIS